MASASPHSLWFILLIVARIWKSRTQTLHIGLLLIVQLHFYHIYPKHSDTFKPYYTCSNTLTRPFQQPVDVFDKKWWISGNQFIPWSDTASDLCLLYLLRSVCPNICTKGKHGNAIATLDISAICLILLLGQTLKYVQYLEKQKSQFGHYYYYYYY